jgi:hypothetical protein
VRLFKNSRKVRAMAKLAYSIVVVVLGLLGGFWLVSGEYTKSAADSGFVCFMLLILIAEKVGVWENDK